MSETHWKKLINPDYLGAYSLEPGQDMILTIKQVRKEVITGTGGKKEECIVCHWQENQKPMILNVTNCKTIAKLTKTPFIEKWAGTKVQIYSDMTKFGGEMVECLRIRSKAPEVRNFQLKLEKYGINVTIRREMGADIDGACGQLRKRYRDEQNCK